MAIALRLSGLNRISIHLGWEGTFSSCKHGATLAGEMESTVYFLENIEPFNGGIVIHDAKLHFEQILMHIEIKQPVIRICDKQTGYTLHSESLFFHQSFFVPFFDYARIEQGLWQVQTKMENAPEYEKPELLAIFTHVYNEDDMLTMWERHYSKLTSHRHLYVIDHGSTRSAKEMLKGETNLVAIPRGGVDHANITGFCNHFQRFLLKQYKWVIHVDCDEFLIYEGGVEAFLKKLANATSKLIIRPEYSYELIHDYRSEAPLISSQPISLQRSILKPAELYRKPVMSSVPTTWAMGFHSAFEDYLFDAASLWLIHLAWVDLERTFERHLKWKNIQQSQADAIHVPQASRLGSLQELQGKFDALLKAEGIDVPEWMRGIF